MVLFAVPIGTVLYLVSSLSLLWLGRELVLQAPLLTHRGLGQIRHHVLHRPKPAGSANATFARLSFPPEFDRDALERNATLAEALNATNLLVYSRRTREYDEALHAFDNAIFRGPSPLLRHTHFPLAVVRVRDTADVQTAVRAALRLGLRLGVTSCGDNHGAGALAPENALLLDLGALAAVQVDSAALTATVGPAAVFRDLQRAYEPLRAHFPGPLAPRAGLGAFLLGGNVGWGGSYFGAGADNVLSISVVDLVSGALQTANATHNADLFYALRGTSPPLAVAVAFTLQLYPLSAAAAAEMPTATMLFEETRARWRRPFPRLGKVLAAFSGLAAAPPPAFESAIALVQGSRSATKRPAVRLLWSSIGFAPLKTLQEPLRRIGALGVKHRAVFSEQRAAPYAAISRALDASAQTPTSAVYGAQLHFAHPVPPEAFALLLDALAAAPRDGQHAVLVGASAPAALPEPNPSPSPDNSVAYRGSLFVGIYATWRRTDRGGLADSDGVHVRWVADLVQDLEPLALGVRRNTVPPSCELPDIYEAMRAGHGGLADERLVSARAHWDPLGLFGWL